MRVLVATTHVPFVRGGAEILMNHLWENRTWAKALGKAGRDRYDSLDITWSNVIGNLLS